MPLMSGTFEYIEAKIRRAATGTAFGRDFEWLCKWYLENASIYRGLFRKVWRWSEWPDRWGRDCGIDLIAETRAELDEALQHELRLLWRDYALVPDEKLTRGAQALKRRLLAAFRAVPHAA